MLVLQDRAFFSAPYFWHLKQRGAHALALLKSNVLTRAGERLADGSVLLTVPLRLCAPKKQSKASKQRDKSGRLCGQRRKKPAKRATLRLRIISYTINDPSLPGYGQTFRLATTLLDPVTAPALELVDCYHERWEIESCIDELDTHQRLADRPLRSRSPQAVKQELYGLLLAHYCVRALMHQSALEADLDPDQLSFTHALSLVQEAIREFAMTDPEQHPDLLARLLADLRCRQSLLPPRRLRANPRVVKRRFSKFPKKHEHHVHQPTVRSPFLEVVALLF